VTVDTTSLLYQITGTHSGIVTSNHHQAADQIAPGLKVSSRAQDRLVEALEWGVSDGKAFLLGVQWHPERMALNNPLSGKVGRAFLFAASSKGISTGE
jgi:putative glutamine amidotransferase